MMKYFVVWEFKSASLDTPLPPFRSFKVLTNLKGVFAKKVYGEK